MRSGLGPVLVNQPIEKLYSFFSWTPPTKIAHYCLKHVGIKVIEVHCSFFLSEQDKECREEIFQGT